MLRLPGCAIMAEATQCQTLKKGDEFSSLVLLEKAIKKFKDSENCNLSKFNTRTIKGAKRKGLKRHLIQNWNMHI
ncbi:hypothetical protein QTP88_023045 [Uroleucon formosanum]